MRRVVLKVIAMSIVVSNFAIANDIGLRSIQVNSIHKVNNNSINRNVLQEIQRKALTSVGNELGVDTAIFNKKNKLSVYLKVSSTSRVGFRYKF